MSTNTESPFPCSTLYLQLATDPVVDVLDFFECSMGGITLAAVEENRKVHGSNHVVATTDFSALRTLVAAFANRLNALLVTLAAVLIATGDVPDAVICFSMVLIGAGFVFWQEYKSNNAVSQLKKLVSSRTTVWRQRPVNSKAPQVPVEERDAAISSLGHPSEQATLIERSTLSANSSSDAAYRFGPVYESVLMEIDSWELVPGDVLALAGGSVLPADCRIIDANGLMVATAALNGESLPVEKSVHAPDLIKQVQAAKRRMNEESSRTSSSDEEGRLLHTVQEEPSGTLHDDASQHALEEEGAPAAVSAEPVRVPINESVSPPPVPFVEQLDLLTVPNLLFAGCHVVSGSARAVVMRTGNETYLQALAAKLSAPSTETSFDRGLAAYVSLMMKLMLIMAPFVLVINGSLHGDWWSAFLFAVAVAVGLTPEMLPMIVAVNLAKGALAMAERKCIVKRLNAIQNFGAMNVLCSDKTGTLTNDHVQLSQATDAFGTCAEKKIESNPSAPTLHPATLQLAFLNSHYQAGLRNHLDAAVLDASEQRSLPSLFHIDQHVSKIDEVPFDFMRRRMSVIVQTMVHGVPKQVIICKGAIEEVASVCKNVMQSGLEEDLGSNPSMSTLANFINSAATQPAAAVMPRSLAYARELNEQGFRCLAVAYRVLENDEVQGELRSELAGEDMGDSSSYLARPASSSPRDSRSMERDLTLAGYLMFLDPPKPSTAAALLELRSQGLDIKVLTGDNDAIARNVCAKVGFDTRRVVLGPELDGLDEKQATELINSASVFAKLSPFHKERIVRLLQKQGKCVGFMGDGINDAAALRAADCGISVDNAVDIAKESADILMLEKDLSVLSDGVREGRRVFGNILKYVRMAASSNFGNIFSVLGLSALLPFDPLTATQLLSGNLLYDFSQVAIPFDEVDPEFIALPQKWDMVELAKFIVCIGPISSIFDYTTYFVMWYYFHANRYDADTNDTSMLYQTGWWVEGLISQTLIVHVIRSRRMPFVSTWASPVLTLSTSVIIAMALAMPYIPGLNSAIGLTHLPGTYYAFLLAEMVGYLVLTQVLKSFYYKYVSTTPVNPNNGVTDPVSIQVNSLKSVDGSPDSVATGSPIPLLDLHLAIGKAPMVPEVNDADRARVSVSDRKSENDSGSVQPAVFHLDEHFQEIELEQV